MCMYPQGPTVPDPGAPPGTHVVWKRDADYQAPRRHIISVICFLCDGSLVGRNMGLVLKSTGFLIKGTRV